MTASQCVLSSLALILKSKRAFHDLGAFITDAEWPKFCRVVGDAVLLNCKLVSRDRSCDSFTRVRSS